MKDKKYPIPVLLAGLPKGMAESAVNNYKKTCRLDEVREVSKVWDTINTFRWEDTKEGWSCWFDTFSFYYSRNI